MSAATVDATPTADAPEVDAPHEPVPASHTGYDAVKRGLDIALAGGAMLATLPLQAALAVAVAKNLGRPVLFTQERPGKDATVFRLRKFRTMRNPDATHVTDAERLTDFGRFLRSTSLDELPSLWNIVKGDMSLVGPRPLLVSYLPLYTPRQARRHEVRPGLTGLAQVNGRNATTWGRRLAWDVEYVDHRSLALDARIVWRTLASVFRREGISQEGEATMSFFTGAADEEIR